MMTNEQEVKCFGLTEEIMRAMCHEKDDLGMLMHAMSILSNAQHIIESSPEDEARESARQAMNVAKYFIGEVRMNIRKNQK